MEFACTRLLLGQCWGRWGIRDRVNVPLSPAHTTRLTRLHRFLPLDADPKSYKAFFYRHIFECCHCSRLLFFALRRSTFSPRSWQSYEGCNCSFKKLEHNANTRKYRFFLLCSRGASAIGKKNTKIASWRALSLIRSFRIVEFTTTNRLADTAAPLLGKHFENKWLGLALKIVADVVWAHPSGIVIEFREECLESDGSWIGNFVKNFANPGNDIIL